MGAYNWLKFEARCPACGRIAELRAQIHVAASYNGDETGRFFGRTFQLGERMPWFPHDHKKYLKEWDASDGVLTPLGSGHEESCAYCLSCESELIVTVEFNNLVPIGVSKLRVTPGEER